MTGSADAFAAGLAAFVVAALVDLVAGARRDRRRAAPYLIGAAGAASVTAAAMSTREMAPAGRNCCVFAVILLLRFMASRHRPRREGHLCLRQADPNKGIAIGAQE